MHLLLLLLSTFSFGLANPIDLFSPYDPSTPSNLTARSEVNGQCTGENGAPGVCIQTDSCTADGGRYISNACPGTPDNVKCCTKASCSSGGNCRWASQCSGSTASGFCPGPTNFKCCLSGGSSGQTKENGPCTGENGAPGVCIKTSSCSADGGRYISNACPGTPDDVKCCTKASCSSGGNCRWTNQCSGSSASGFCPGPSDFKCCLSGGGSSGGGGESSINSPISRSEIVTRGRYWTSRNVPYSQSATYPDSEGTRYRTDCSGFVSMALHTNHPGYSTVTLPEIAVRIEWDQLQEGDFVGTLGAGTGGDDGHVVLFHSWVDSSRKRFKTLECRGSQGCVASERPKAFEVGSKSALPYKYKRVI